MSSVRRVLLALLLLSGLRGRTVAGQDGDKDEPGALPGGENAAVLGRNFVWDVTDEGGSPKVLMLPDTRRRGPRFRALNHRLPMPEEPRWTYNPAGERMDRRDVDIDVLRCMIGRVYRPCWGGTLTP